MDEHRTNTAGGLNESLSFERQLAAEKLLVEAGFTELAQWTPLAGGKNNRVYRVSSDRGSVLLKVYFRHPEDDRRRLAHEFAFSRFAWQRNVRALPRPISADFEHDLALYEFVEGSKADVADESLVNQAVDFFLALNEHRGEHDATTLPEGSEACFSLTEHAEMIERRLHLLGEIEATSDVDRQAQTFVAARLRPAGMIVLSQARHSAARQSFDWHEPLDAERRCVSPSDFGFHNALIKNDGRAVFFDFEYAGWDDPARTVADFFCQPRVPVPTRFFDAVAGRIAECFAQPDQAYQRMRLLLPIYRLKWCCILLNEFLPQGAGRRSFAARDDDEQARKAVQLAKAEAALDTLLEPIAPAAAA